MIVILMKHDGNSNDSNFHKIFMVISTMKALDPSTSCPI